MSNDSRHIQDGQKAAADTANLVRAINEGKGSLEVNCTSLTDALARSNRAMENASSEGKKEIVDTIVKEGGPNRLGDLLKANRLCQGG